MKNTGIIFIGPIIGFSPSLNAVFNSLRGDGVLVEGIDIFEEQNLKKTSWKLLGLTALPGSHKRRVAFANNYNEPLLFGIIKERIEKLKAQGVKKIILGGMSGGFIFAARAAQDFHDPSIRGLIGISPLVFYPAEVFQKGVDLSAVPPHIPTLLIWGDSDSIVPEGTISYAERIAKHHPHVFTRVIRGSEAGVKDGKIKHQFFGGRDFTGKIKNAFWNEAAEKIAVRSIEDMVNSIQ